MTVWLEQKEKILCHEKYIEWYLKQLSSSCMAHLAPAVLTSLPASESHLPAQSTSKPSLPPSTAHFTIHPTILPAPPTSLQHCAPAVVGTAMLAADQAHPSAGAQTSQYMDVVSIHSSPYIYMVCHPSVKGVSFDDIKGKYGTTYFHDALTCYIMTINHSDLMHLQVEDKLVLVYLPFKSVPIYNKVKLLIKDPDGLAVSGTGAHDVIHACVTHQRKGGGVVGGHFDTALICDH